MDSKNWYLALQLGTPYLQYMLARLYVFDDKTDSK